MNSKKTAALIVISMGIATSVQATSLSPADNSIATNLCLTAATGNRAAMHNEIKFSGFSSNFVANNVTCNGMNLLSFIELKGKNPAAMLKILDRTKTSVSITDIASNTLLDK